MYIDALRKEVGYLGCRGVRVRFSSVGVGFGVWSFFCTPNIYVHPKNIPVLGHFYCKNLMSINIYDTRADEMMMWHLCGIQECIRNSHSHMWTHVFSWEHSLHVWEHPLVPHENMRSHMGTIYTNKLGNTHGNSKSHQCGAQEHIVKMKMWKWRPLWRCGFTMRWNGQVTHNSCQGDAWSNNKRSCTSMYGQATIVSWKSCLENQT